MNNVIQFPTRKQSFLPRPILKPEDLIGLFSSTTIVPSNLGMQLARLREGRTNSYPNYQARAEQAEKEILDKASVIRCQDELCSVKKVNFSYVHSVSRVAKLSGSNEGSVIVGILRAFYHWHTISEERALAEVYTRASSFLGRAPYDDIYELVGSFRENKAKRARKFASSLRDESSMALVRWIDLWNDKERM